jgi:Rad3-related DNA helicase
MKEEKAIEEIRQWFDTEIYFEGVQLYAKYGSNDYLKQFFADGTERHRRNLLTSELKELLELLEQAQEQKKEARPSELQQLLREAGSLMDERTALKERARQLIERKLDTPQELGEIALEIMQRITPRLNEIFGLRDFYEANGYLPETAAIAVQSISELYTRRNTLRTYLSRTATKGSPKRQLWLNELFAIDQKLKGLNDAISNE